MYHIIIDTINVIIFPIINVAFGWVDITMIQRKGRLLYLYKCISLKLFPSIICKSGDWYGNQS